MAHPRGLDSDLIDAYLARRALDYLFGFTLSPVLWRKLPGAKSAGRVQSVALRLICEREAEIEAFRAEEYWTIDGAFTTAEDRPFSARLTHLDGQKLEKFSIRNKVEADAAVARLTGAGYRIGSVERKQVRRHPQPPFTTSTLQQEASRKLGMSATQTMRTAQRLYEGVDIGGETVGLITYMRTDGLTLAGEAIAQARQAIGNLYGQNYVPGQPRVYKSTAKNAQEAHEAIRPTDLRRRPEDVARFLSREELRLYELIWKRTMACQMESAVLDQAIVDVADARQTAVFRAVGTVVRFDGFLKVYQEDRDDPAAPGEDADESQRRLPAIPFRLVVPNLITVLAICAGLSGVRMAFEGRFDIAVALVLVAALLDAISDHEADLNRAESDRARFEGYVREGERAVQAGRTQVVDDEHALADARHTRDAGRIEEGA